jgi:hypothetical protein
MFVLDLAKVIACARCFDTLRACMPDSPTFAPGAASCPSKPPNPQPTPTYSSTHSASFARLRSGRETLAKSAKLAKAEEIKTD